MTSAVHDRGARDVGSSAEGARPSATPSLAEVARVLAEEAGLSLGDGLDHALGVGLRRAAASLGTDGETLTRKIVGRDAAAVAALVEHAAVFETAFWRHPEQLEAVAEIAAASPGSLRIWSAGCATGEEPYSIAIALLEAGRLGLGDAVLATDVATGALEVASAATYDERALRRLPFGVAARWFEPGVRRRVAPEARALVTFQRHNLVRDPPPAAAPFDVVLCRNVLIYFDPATAAAVLYRLVSALVPGGLLVLGPVELPLARALELDWVKDGGATLLRRPR